MSNLNTYKIFLASSERLSEERKAFEIEIGRFNDDLAKKNARLEVVIWEKLDAGIDPIRKQNAYNEALKSCHIVVMVYWGELGLFTKEEYLLALNLLKETKKPRIYIFKKTNPLTFTPNPKNVENLNLLEAELSKKEEDQWPCEFDHTDTFLKKIIGDIRALFENPEDSDFIFGPKATCLSPNGTTDPPDFLGREEELKTIRERLSKGGKLMLISAEGGIGKTTLAAKYWHENLYNYKHNAWLFCENGIISALKELAPKLNVDLAEYKTEAEQVRALKFALSKVQDNCLLILDNANNAEDIEVFRQEFEGFHWHVLITSRCQGVLHESQELPITHLPPPLAKQLFERNYKEESPEFDALLDKVLEAIRYHTLLVDLFSKNLKKVSKNGLNLKNFLEKLENEGLFLYDDSRKVQTFYTGAVKHKVANTDDIINILYDFSQLDEKEDERLALVRLALFPAETYTDEFLGTLMTEQDKASKKQYFITLESLFTKGWISGTMNENYRLSPVIQSLVLKRNEASLSSDATLLLNNLCELLEHDQHNFLHISIPEAAPYVKPFEHLTKCLQNYPSIELATYNFSVGIYFDNIGELILSMKCFINLHQICLYLYNLEPINIYNKNNLAGSYQYLGRVYNQIGDLANALTNFQESFKISKEIYASSPENLSYKNSLAISYSKLGEIYEQTGDWESALNNYQEFNRMSKEIHGSNPENLSYKSALALSYDKIAKIYKQSENWINAITNSKKCIELSKEICVSNPNNPFYKHLLAISNESLGEIYLQSKDWINALGFFQERNRISKEISENYPSLLIYKSSLAVSYNQLGCVYLHINLLKDALTNFQTYNKLCIEIHESSPENLGYKHHLSISYQNLGIIYKKNSDWKCALKNFQEFNKLCKEIYESSSDNVTLGFGLARSYNDLGEIFEETGELETALSNFLEYNILIKQIFQKNNNNLEYKKRLADSYHKICKIYVLINHWDNAMFNYQEYDRLYKEIYNKNLA